MDDTVSSLLQVIAAYSFPVQQGDRDQTILVQNSKPELARTDELTKQLQMLISENAYLRDALHQQTESTPVLRKSSNHSTSPQPRSPISPMSRGKSGNLRILPGEPNYLTFLQNQVSFLRTALNQSQTGLPAQPVFIVQGEFFLLLKDALSKSLHTISLFLGQLNDQGDSLYQTYQELQGKASSYSVKYAFDATLFEQLMRLVDECEGFKQKIFSVYTGKIEMLSSEMTNLLQESYKIVISLAGSISEEADIHELKSWNERKIEISTEKGTFELLLCKRQMLFDLETLKTNLLVRNFGTETAAASRLPRCNVKKPISKPLPDPPVMEPQQMLQYVSTQMSELTEALNQAKAAVGTWAWRSNVLLPSPMRVCRNMHDLGVALKASKTDIEQITKVSLADKPEIEKRVLRTFREDALTETVAEKAAELEEAQQRELLYQACLEQLKSEMDRALEEERGKNSDLELTVSNLGEEKAQLANTLTIYITLSDSLQRDITAFILRVNMSVFHSEAASLPEIADLIEALYRVYQESIETVVMESFEPQLLVLGHGSKLRGSGSDSEAVWKGMKYLVRAAERGAEKAGVSPRNRELGDEVSALMMKTMQHYVYEDLKSIEEKLDEEREGRRVAELERDGLRDERNALVDEKSELIQTLESTTNVLRYYEALEADKTAQLALTTSTLEELKSDYEREKAAHAYEASILNSEKCSLSESIGQLRLQLEDLERENDLLRNQLRIHEMPVYSSELQNHSEENGFVSKGAGGNMLFRVNKGLDYTVHYLSKLLGRDFGTPEETMQKQAVVYDQLVEVERLLKEKGGLHTEVDRLNEEIRRLWQNEESLRQVNALMQQELDRLPVSHKAQIDALTATHLQDFQQLKSAHGNETANLRREIESLKAEHHREVSTLMQQIVTAETIVISSEAEIRDMSEGTRLQTTSSIEEKLMKGFEYICIRAKTITNNAEELPKEPIDKQKYLYQRLEDIERSLAELRLEIDALNSKAAEDEKRHKEVVAEKETQYIALRSRWTDDVGSRDSLISQLRSQIAQMETSIAVDISQSDGLPSDEFFRHMRRGDGYSRKVAEGFRFLNEKLEELVPVRGAMPEDILENQAEMLKLCNDVQRLVADTKDERDRVNEELRRSQEEVRAVSDNLAAERSNLHRKTEELANLHARSTSEISQLTAAIEQKDAQIKKFTDDNLREQIEIQALNQQLRKRLAEVESLVYVSSSTAEDFASVDFMYPRVRGTAYHDKVCKGFKYLNEKLGELIPTEANHSNHMLENQLQMYKTMVEIQRTIAVAKDEKEKADQEVKVLNGDKEKLNNTISTLFDEKAKEFKSNITQITKLKDEIEALKAEAKKRDDNIWKLKTAVSDSERQQVIIRQSLEDVKKENQNLRTQLGTDFLIAYPTDQMSPSTDDTPRKLQSSGSLETKLDKGLELILALMEQVTRETHDPQASLLEKEKSVLTNAQHLLDTIVISRDSAKGQTLELSSRLETLTRDKQDLQERMKTACEQLKKSTEDKDRLEVMNKSLLEQLTVQDLVGGESGPLETPAETRSHLQAGQTLEEKLSKGFDYSIAEVSKILGRKATPPEAMLDKQRMLFDIISLLSRQQDQFRNILLQFDQGCSVKEVGMVKNIEERVSTLEGRIQGMKVNFVGKVRRYADLLHTLREELAMVKHHCAIHSEELATRASQMAAQQSDFDSKLSDMQAANSQLVQRLADMEQETINNAAIIKQTTDNHQSATEVALRLQIEKSELEQQVTQACEKLRTLEISLEELNRAKEESDKLLNESRDQLSAEEAKARQLEQNKWETEKLLRDFEDNTKALQKEICENEGKIAELHQMNAELAKRLEEVETRSTDARSQLDRNAASTDSQIAELRQCALLAQSEIEIQKDTIQKYQRALSQTLSNIEAALPGSEFSSTDDPEEDCKPIVALVKALVDQLMQVNGKWTMWKQAVNPILNEIGTNIEDLPDDFISLSEESIESASEKVRNLVSELLRSQKEIMETLNKKTEAVETSHISEGSEHEPFAGSTHADFLAWVLTRSHTCLTLWELTPAIYESVRKVYELAKELNQKFGLVPEDAPNGLIISLSNMAEVYLSNLVNFPIEGLRPVQTLMVRRTAMIHALGKVSAEKYTERQEQLQGQMEKLSAELEEERERANTADQSYAKESLSHASTKSACEQLLKEKQKLEKLIEELQIELKALMDAKTKTQEEVMTPETTQLHEIGSKLRRALQGEQKAAMVAKCRNILTKTIYRGCVEFLSKWKEFPRQENKYTDPSQYAEDDLKSVKLALVRSNPLLHIATSQGSVAEKPMSEFMLLKLTAEILVARVTKEYPGADTLPKFTLEYLTEKNKSRDLALKQVRQIVPTLYAFDDEDFYGKMLARLFQVKNPLSNSLVSFFVKANFGMQKFIEKRLQEKAKKSNGKKVSTDIDPMTGGIIFLCDALSLIYELKIDEDPNVCRRVLNHLRDPDMDKTDYITFIINHRLEWLKINTEQFFHHIDPTNRGVAIDFLIDTLLDKLKLCVSRKKLDDSFRSKVDRNRSGNIGKEEFNVYMDVTYYALNAAHESYSVQRNVFLSVICEIYDMTIEELVAKIKCAFTGNSGSESGLQAALQVILPTVSADELARCITDMRSTAPDAAVTPEHFLSFLAGHEVQGLFVKPFSKC